MFKQFAFGLKIASNRPIPQLDIFNFEGPPELQIHLGSRPDLRNETCSPHGNWEYLNRKVFRHSPSGMFSFLFHDGTEFYLDATCGHIWTTWTLPNTVEDMSTYLLGPILGFALRLRNMITLHASAIVVGNRAMAILGPPQSGKSTTAAAMAIKGYSVLADDVAALTSSLGNFAVLPAYPHLRLWPESAELLCGSSHSLAPITPNWDKRDFPLIPGRTFAGEPLRLGAVYVLGTRQPAGPAPYVTETVGREGFLALLGNTYGNAILDERMRAEEFGVLARLAKHVPVRRAVPHTSPDRVWQLCDVLLEDFARYGSGNS